jgi:hypothetical protein
MRKHWFFSIAIFVLAVMGSSSYATSYISVRDNTSLLITPSGGSITPPDSISGVVLNDNESVRQQIGDNLEVRAMWSGSYKPACIIPLTLLKQKGIDPLQLTISLTNPANRVSLTCYLKKAKSEIKLDIDDQTKFSQQMIAEDVSFSSFLPHP